MVDIAMMRDRAVLWTNIVAVIAGFAMFGTFLLVPSFVQAGAGCPTRSGRASTTASTPA
jgi:hypothetical protein